MITDKLRKVFFFSLIYYALIIVLNAFSWIISKIFFFMILSDYSFIATLGGVLVFYIPIVFVFSFLLGIKKVGYIFPIIYLGLSIYIMYPTTLEGHDLMHLLNFHISMPIVIIYSVILRKTHFLDNNIINLVFFNLTFFLYQVVLLYCSKKITDTIANRMQK